MAPHEKGVSKNLPLTSSTQVRHVVGSVTDDTILAILEIGASVEELEVVASYLRGEGNQVDRRGHAMTGKVARLYDILTADELYANGERQPVDRRDLDRSFIS
jgi:hypothetical protein